MEHAVSEPGTYWIYDGRWHRNVCVCGFRGYMFGGPSENALDEHFRTVGLE